MVEKLMTLQERWEANQARKAFDIAMAEAQGEMPLMVKNRLVNYKSEKSPTGFVTYKHEDLAEVVETVKPVLKKHGLSHRFRTEHLEGGQIRVTCVITGHGHREENSLQSSRDTTGGKNNLQEIASTVTYLERYTLKAALGLAAAHDDDGKTAEGANTITAQQAKELTDKCKEVADGFDSSFCNYFGIETIADLPAKDYQRALIAIGKKKGTAK